MQESTRPSEPPATAHSRRHVPAPTREGNAIRIHCESCLRRLKIPHEQAGRRCFCPTCHHKVQIPNLSELPAPVASTLEQILPPAKRPRRTLKERIGIALQRDLIHLQATSETASQTIAVIQHPRRWIQRHTWMGLALTVCLLLVGSAIAAKPWIKIMLMERQEIANSRVLLLDLDTMQIVAFPHNTKPTPDTGAEVVYWSDKGPQKLQPGMRWTELGTTDQQVLWLYRQRPDEKWTAEYAHLESRPKWRSAKDPEFEDWIKGQIKLARDACPRGCITGIKP